MKTYKINVNGKMFEVQLEEVSETTAKMVEPTAKKAVKSTASEDQISVTAPMQGNMWKILVSDGEEVSEGQVLAILEAMKMENEILAPCSGVVEEVCVETGQNVNLGQEIFLIKS